MLILESFKSKMKLIGKHNLNKTNDLKIVMKTEKLQQQYIKSK